MQRGFEFAEKNGEYVPAAARIDCATIVVSGPLPAPVFVRYAWADNPEATLYNEDGLPASPFRSSQVR